MMRGSGSGHWSDRSSLQVSSGESVPFPFRHPMPVPILGNDGRAKMAEPRWPQREAGAPVDPLPPDPGPSRLRPAGMIRFLRLIAAVSFQ